MKGNKWVYFTLGLIFTAFIGSRLIQLDFGGYHITPYRLACIIGFVYIPFNMKSIQSKDIIMYYIFLLSWILYSFFLFVVSTPDKTGYWETFFFLFCGTITTYYIGAYISDFRLLKKCFYTIEIASLFPFVFAFYEILVGNYLFVDSFNADVYSLDSANLSSLGLRVPISTFTNPNDFSLMILVVLVSSYIMYKLTKGKQKMCHLFLFCISFFLVLAAQSRAATVALFICISIIFLFKFSNLNSSRKRQFFAMIPLIVVLLYWIYTLYQDIIEPILFLDFEGGDTIRTNLILNGFHYLDSSYYLGVGLGNIEYYMLHYSIFDTGTILNIHNWWMEILVSSGVFIFSWYVFMYFRLTLRMLNGVKKVHSPGQKYVFVLSFSFLIMFVIDSVSSSSLARIECSWVIMAIMFLVPSIVPKERVICKN